MGALVRKIGENIHRISDDALDDSGYVMNLVKATGDVRKAITSHLAVYGVNFMSTNDPITTLAIASQDVAIIREGEVSVKVSPTNSAIVAGDLLIAVTGGLVDLYTPTAYDNSSVANLATSAETRLEELSKIVGYAEEAVGGATGGKIRCKLQLVKTVGADI